MLSELINNSVYTVVEGITSAAVNIKIEGCNLAGSIKLKTAIGLIEEAERQGLIFPETKIIESSSGNLGVALALVAAQRGYDFTCVIDPNTTDFCAKLIKSYGARTIVVDWRDANGGFLGSRIEYIEQQLARDKTYLWLNQYGNPAGPEYHFNATAKAIDRRFPRVDFLFIGAGTTGTLMGCAKYFHTLRPTTKVVAVDSEGSVTFGGRASPRHVPGLGTSRRPEICSEVGLHEVVVVPEIEGIKMCHWLARNKGLMLGGSSGSVLAAVRQLSDSIRSSDVVVAISPDNGEKYIDTIYDELWLKRKFPEITQAWEELSLISG